MTLISLDHDQLPIIIHGPQKADITLICYGLRSSFVINTAELLCSEGLKTNVLQVTSLAPLPARQLASLIRISSHILVVELDTKIDVHKQINDQAGIDILHTYRINPQISNNKEELIHKIKQTFTIDQIHLPELI